MNCLAIIYLPHANPIFDHYLNSSSVAFRTFIPFVALPTLFVSSGSAIKSALKTTFVST
jgi:hypothetical protein